MPKKLKIISSPPEEINIKNRGTGAGGSNTNKMVFHTKNLQT